MTGHARAQVLYYLAENMAVRKAEFVSRLIQMVGVDIKSATQEVELSIERIYYYAAMADKYDGNVHHTTSRNVTLAMPEAIGVMGIVCPEESPLLSFISLVISAISMGNNVIVIPSEQHPLMATDFYQILDTSDVPGGVVNIITGKKEELTKVLTNHDNIDGLWYFGSEGSKMVEHDGADNMKRTWVSYGKHRDWFSPEQGEGQEFLRHATQIKNIWIPYGE